MTPLQHYQRQQGRWFSQMVKKSDCLLFCGIVGLYVILAGFATIFQWKDYELDNLVIGKCGDQTPDIKNLKRIGTDTTRGSEFFADASVTINWEPLRWYKSGLQIAGSTSKIESITLKKVFTAGSEDQLVKKAVAWAIKKIDADGDGLCYSYAGDKEWYMTEEEALTNEQWRWARLAQGILIATFGCCMLAPCVLDILGERPRY